MDEYKTEEDALRITTYLGLRATEVRKHPEDAPAFRVELARIRRSCEATISDSLGDSSERKAAIKLNRHIIEILDRNESELPSQ